MHLPHGMFHYIEITRYVSTKVIVGIPGMGDENKDAGTNTFT